MLWTGSWKVWLKSTRACFPVEAAAPSTPVKRATTWTMMPAIPSWSPTASLSRRPERLAVLIPVCRWRTRFTATLPRHMVVLLSRVHKQQPLLRASSSSQSCFSFKIHSRSARHPTCKMKSSRRRPRHPCIRSPPGIPSQPAMTVGRHYHCWRAWILSVLPPAAAAVGTMYRRHSPYRHAIYDAARRTPSWRNTPMRLRFSAVSFPVSTRPSQ